MLIQKNIQIIAFSTSLDAETLNIDKCDFYSKITKNEDMKIILKEFKKISNEHIKVIHSKMTKLNVQE